MKSALILIPDGGWGWVIVTCSFLIHMFVVGTVYALSVLYVAWLDQFQDGKGLTSWIISLAVAVMFGIGPIPGSLGKRFGNRAVVICGGLIMCLGFVASYFAMNVYFLVVSIGIVTGTGAGCCYLPSVSMVAIYFTRKRSIAMGIAASGLGAGAFCMAPFLDWLVEYYGWRGCMLILAGISLNMCVLGAMMRPLEKAPKCRNCHWEKDGDVLSVDFSLLSLKNLATSECNAIDSCAEECEEHCDEVCGERHPAGLIGACRGPNANLYRPLPSSEVVEQGVSPVAYFPAHPAVIQQADMASKSFVKGLKACSDDPHHVSNYSFGLPSKQQIIINSSHLSGSSDNYIYHQITNQADQKIHGSNPNNKFLDIVRQNDKGKLGGSLDVLSASKDTSANQRKQYSSHVELSGNMAPCLLPVPPPSPMRSLSDLQIMLAGSICSMVYMEKTWKDGSLLSMHSHNQSVTRPASLAVEEIKDYIEDSQTNSYCSKLKASLHTYIKLLGNFTFLTFSISNFLTNLSFFMPVLYMVDRALDSGIERGEAAMLISLYGAGNIFGKLFFGWLADRELVDRLFYYIAALTVCGVSTSISPLCGSSHELHSIYAFVFGCFIGAYVTLVPVVTVDLMGLSVVGESFGLLLFFMGIATAFGTPMAGWIFDWTGSYTISFILHGFFIVLSALMLIPLLVLKKRQQKQQEHHKEEKDDC